MSKMSKVLKYKKIIMIALVFVALIICVTATYVTEYNKNKVEVETLFEAPEEDREYKDEKDFYKNFEYFEIYLNVGSEEAYVDSNGHLIPGKLKYTVESKKGENYNLRGSISIQAANGANWIGYRSEVSASKTHQPGEITMITINNVNQIFPAKGKLWFTNVNKPTLYVMVKWTEKDNERYYTYIELKYDEYSEIPVLPTEDETTK